MPIRKIRLHRPATWDDLEDTPEDSFAEIVNGEIVLAPRPGVPHMRTSSRLGVLLGGPFDMGRGGPGGWVIFDEPRIRFGEEIRVPDLGGWRSERWLEPRSTGPIDVVPDWLCEVLSPATRATDRTTKMTLYARAGVPHVWIIDPLPRTLEIFRLHADGYLLAASYHGDERVRAEPFHAVELDLADLWRGLPPISDEE